MRKNLKIARIRRGLTQNELAAIIGLRGQSISDYESGRTNPSYETMRKIAQALNATVDELFYGNSDLDKAKR